MAAAAQAHLDRYPARLPVEEEGVTVRLLQAAGMAALTIAVVLACGGSPTTPTAAPNVTQGPGAPTAPAPTSEPIGSTPAPIGGVDDLCALLTAAELNSATGKTYAEGSLDSVGQCLWNLEGVSSNTGSLIVGYVQPIDLNFIKSSFGEGGEDLTIAGHPAFYNPTQGLGSLWVDLGGGQTFVLSFPRSFDLEPSHRAIMVQLAELALGRM